MTGDKLTEKKHWDDYWENIQLPAEIKKSAANLLLNEELKVFEKYLPKGPLSALEIGGAPGQYLAYFNKQFGYKVSCLDYSETGCKKTEENFSMLGIPISVYHQDLFDENLSLPKFDFVYSMGLIEHFEEVSGVLEKHLALLKPGGMLMVGLPNFRGINYLFLRFLAPKLLKQHNLKTMDINTWKNFEQKLNLKPIFKGYVGGFEPATFLICEKKSLINNLLFLKARVLNKIFHKKFSSLRKYNSKYFSGYILGIYQKPLN